MPTATYVMLVGCGIIALGIVPFASTGYLASVGIVALGVTIFIIGVLMHSRNSPPTA